MKEIRVGLIGFGTIGAGVAKILRNNQEVIEKRLGASVSLVKIVDLDIKTDRGIDIKEGVLTTSVEEVIDGHYQNQLNQIKSDEKMLKKK